MTTAPMNTTVPLLVSELPPTATAQAPHGAVSTWFARRRVLRQRRAFDHAVATMDPRMAAEVLSAARRDS